MSAPETTRPSAGEADEGRQWVVSGRVLFISRITADGAKQSNPIAFSNDWVESNSAD